MQTGLSTTAALRKVVCRGPIQRETEKTLRIARRFRGPSHSGNGGYVCGRLARLIEGPVSVRLHVPPPLETDLALHDTGGGVRLIHGWTLVAEARPQAFELATPAPRSFEVARQAARNYAGFHDHAFPGCFGCGPDRAPGDGLRIYPGAIGGGPVLGAPWCPDPSLGDDSGAVRPEFLWTALDCPGGWATVSAGLPEGRTIVLGEMQVRISGTLMRGEACVVLAWPLGMEGRKRYAGSAIYSDEGRVIASGRTTWIETPENEFLHTG